MAKNEKETVEKKHRSGLVKDLNAGGDQRVNFNIFLEDLKHMGTYYKSVFGKNLNLDTVKADEVRQMVLHNSLWNIPKESRSSGASAKMAAVTAELSDDEVKELRRKMRAAQEAELDKIIKLRNIKVV